MKKELVLILFALLLISSSYSNDVKSTITGWWTIDTILYNKRDIKPCLLGNSIIFDGDLRLPITENSYPEILTEFNSSGNWDVVKNDEAPLLLEIKSENKIFSGQHKIVFRGDNQNKLLKMEIISSNLYVVCRKGLFDYDADIALVNRLIFLSNRAK